ncbi:MAG: phosphate starvation-inducible protein PhoH, partial [Bacteroidaceae bacterium]|nr:phosphate starvation-inducible protein PhoH [Bacteroidaceae bacterium]
ALRVLQGVKGIGFVQMDERDIVRHKLVTRIVEAYRRKGEEEHNQGQ